MVYDTKLPILFAHTLLIQLQTELQIKETYISTSGIELIDNKLNGIKYKVLKTYNLILKYLMDECSTEQLNSSKFFLDLVNFIPTIIQSLLRYCTGQVDLENASEIKETNNIIVESLSFLSRCTSQNDFYQIFSKIKEE